jgi:hypothetical protein
VTWARRVKGNRNSMKSIFFTVVSFFERTKIGFFVDCGKKTIEMQKMYQSIP